MATSKNGKTATANDATANSATANSATANDATANDATANNAIVDFTDYLPSKVVGMTMFVLQGRRVQHNDPIGIAATGKIVAIFEGENIHFGTLTSESLRLTNDALRMPVVSDDNISNEDIVKMKDEIEKNWCYEVKMQLFADKQQRDFEKKVAKKQKQKAASLAVKQLTGRK